MRAAPRPQAPAADAQSESLDVAAEIVSGVIQFDQLTDGTFFLSQRNSASFNGPGHESPQFY